MKWSAKLGTFAGIDVFVHVTFLALLAYFALVYWTQTGTLVGVLTGLALIVMLFGCVLLHEFGHALTARRFGIRTKYITLLPIGGLAMLESMPKDPRQEIIVALAGPAVNIAIAAVVLALIAISGQAGSLLALDIGRIGFLESLLAANLILAIFNMLPAFPMDGGRVLRAALSLRMDRVRATRLAASIGRALAVGFGFLGLAGNPFLILIAVFVWIGAGAEASAVELDERLADQPASRAMITDFHVIDPQAPLARAIDLTLAGTQKDFPVQAADGAVVGVLTQAAILRGLRDLGAEGRVGQVMRPARSAGPDAPLAVLLADLQENEDRLVCITRGGRLVGIVDLENISEFLRIRAALSGR
jgi:Zn-dependent protease